MRFNLRRKGKGLRCIPFAFAAGLGLDARGALPLSQSRERGICRSVFTVRAPLSRQEVELLEAPVDYRLGVYPEPALKQRGVCHAEVVVVVEVAFQLHVGG